MGILKFKFEKLVVLGIPKTLLLKCFTIELLTLQWGLSRDRVPTSPMDCHHDVPHLNGHILRVLPPFSEIYQDPIVGIFGSIYIYIFSLFPHSYPIGILYVSHSNGPIFFHIGKNLRWACCSNTGSSKDQPTCVSEKIDPEF